MRFSKSIIYLLNRDSRTKRITLLFLILELFISRQNNFLLSRVRVKRTIISVILLFSRVENLENYLSITKRILQ